MKNGQGRNSLSGKFKFHQFVAPRATYHPVGIIDANLTGPSRPRTNVSAKPILYALIPLEKTSKIVVQSAPLASTLPTFHLALSVEKSAILSISRQLRRHPITEWYGPLIFTTAVNKSIMVEYDN